MVFLQESKSARNIFPSNITLWITKVSFKCDGDVCVHVWLAEVYFSSFTLCISWNPIPLCLHEHSCHTIHSVNLYVGIGRSTYITVSMATGEEKNYSMQCLCLDLNNTFFNQCACNRIINKMLYFFFCILFCDLKCTFNKNRYTPLGGFNIFLQNVVIMNIILILSYYAAIDPCKHA